jgi:hypothetical protein
MSRSMINRTIMWLAGISFASLVEPTGHVFAIVRP